jgi:2-phospho-L-lactate guanylyltransferase
VQATVHTTSDSGGSALLDDGREIAWSAEALAGSGLRHLRVGQRVSVELTTDQTAATRVWIVGIGAGQRIR